MAVGTDEGEGAGDRAGLREAIAARAGPSAEPLWRALASRLRLNALPAAQAEQPIVPAEGGALSIKGLQRQKAPLYFAPTHTPLTPTSTAS